MDHIFIIGTIAACLTTAAFFPQVVKAHNSRHTKDISIAMCILLAFGVALWTIYGLYLQSHPIIAANSITFALTLYLIYLKKQYG
ncbi:MAG: SemiSWEET transporter [Candidatus Margulisiibacteriota bacterium]|nr:SemiSWEET transporter [Candidatus Margulisiibacteriota bacterium]